MRANVAATVARIVLGRREPDAAELAWRARAEAAVVPAGTAPVGAARASMPEPVRP
jgi:hypothetical protein